MILAHDTSTRPSTLQCTTWCVCKSTAQSLQDWPCTYPYADVVLHTLRGLHVTTTLLSAESASGGNSQQDGSLHVLRKIRISMILLTAESVSGGNSQQDGSLHITVPSASAVAAQRHRVQQQMLLQLQQHEQQQQQQEQQQQQQEEQQQQQQAEQQAEHESQRAQHESQRAQYGSQPAQQQAQQQEGNIQSVSHKRRLSQAFAQVRGFEQTPGDEEEDEQQAKRQRHCRGQASCTCTCHHGCCLTCVFEHHIGNADDDAIGLILIIPITMVTWHS